MGTSRPTTSRSPATRDNRSGLGSTCPPTPPDPCPGWWSSSHTAEVAASRGNGCSGHPPCYADLVMDTRGQGGSWSGGDTPDPGPDGAGPSHPGFMTRGALDPHHLLLPPADHRRRSSSRCSLRMLPQYRGVTRLAVDGPKARAAAWRWGPRPWPLTGSPRWSPQVPFLCDFRRALADHRREPRTTNWCASSGSILLYCAWTPCWDTLNRHRHGPHLVPPRDSRLSPCLRPPCTTRELPAVHRLRRLPRLRRPEGDGGLRVGRP